MSFLRHREIYRSDVSRLVRERRERRPRSHRLDEFPAGYSWADCSPAGSASASPTEHHSALKSSCRSIAFHRTANTVLTVCLSSGGHPSKAFVGFLSIIQGASEEELAAEAYTGCALHEALCETRSKAFNRHDSLLRSTREGFRKTSEFGVEVIISNGGVRVVLSASILLPDNGLSVNWGCQRQRGSAFLVQLTDGRQSPRRAFHSESALYI
jgi:hypothetical protein